MTSRRVDRWPPRFIGIIILAMRWCLTAYALWILIYVYTATIFMVNRTSSNLVRKGFCGIDYNGEVVKSDKSWYKYWKVLVEQSSVSNSILFDKQFKAKQIFKMFKIVRKASETFVPSYKLPTRFF